jgi:hypothetical protein
MTLVAYNVEVLAKAGNNLVFDSTRNSLPAFANTMLCAAGILELV